MPTSSNSISLPPSSSPSQGSLATVALNCELSRMCEALNEAQSNASGVKRCRPMFATSLPSHCPCSLCSHVLSTSVTVGRPLRRYAEAFRPLACMVIEADRRIREEEDPNYFPDEVSEDKQHECVYHFCQVFSY
jgi:hypothetical protein